MVETVIQLAAEKLEPKEATRTVVDNLMPRTVYSFNVSAYFLDSEAWGRPRRIDVETLSDGIPACIPHTHTHTRAHTRLMALFRDYPGEPVPES